MEKTGRVTLIAPAKVGGKRLAAGATPEVTPAIAIQLAEMGAIEASAAEIDKAKAALTTAAGHSVDGIASIVELMKGEKADALKTDAGNWSAAKIGAALGRKVGAQEIEAAATAAGLT